MVDADTMGEQIKGGDEDGPLKGCMYKYHAVCNNSIHYVSRSMDSGRVLNDEFIAVLHGESISLLCNYPSHRNVPTFVPSSFVVADEGYLLVHVSIEIF